jgi:hypothetical protein
MADTRMADTARGEGFRPAPTKDAGKIRLGGGFRPAVQTKDAGRIRLGGGFRRAR